MFRTPCASFLAVVAAASLSGAACAGETSIYVGVQAAGAWGDSDFFFPDLGSKTVPVDADGALFGAHVGVDHSFETLFLGAEVSIAVADIDGGNITPGGVSCSSTVAPANRVLCRVNDVETLTTAVLRAGLHSGAWKAYATGGYATAEISTDGLIVLTGVATVPDHQWHDGWTYGVGADYQVSSDWSLGIEYKRIELDDERHAQAAGAGNRRDVDLSLDLVQVKLSYRFGS